MSHKYIGTATIDHQVTSIRKYENGSYTVEVNGDLIYSSWSLQDLEKKLDNDCVKHNVVDRS